MRTTHINIKGAAPVLLLAVAALVCSIALSPANAKPSNSEKGEDGKCPPGACAFVTTEKFGSTTVQDLLKASTPIGECPEAAETYSVVGRDVAGFFGPCPTSEQLADVKPVTEAEQRGMATSLDALRANRNRKARRAVLFCPPDCVGTPQGDMIEGDGSANDIRGAGAGDSIIGWGGPDIVRGEAGTDTVQTVKGNGEIARGGDGDADYAVTWDDPGTDYAYGGNGSLDACLVDVTDEVDSSCESTNLP